MRDQGAPEHIGTFRNGAVIAADVAPGIVARLLTILCGFIIFAVPAAAQQSLPKWSLVQELRIGAIDGPDALDALGEVIVSPKTGNVFVTETSQRILVFDGAGRRLRVFGGEGGGPGEFQRLLDIFWSEGLVVATDGGNHLVTTFTEQGEVVEARRIEFGPLTGVVSRTRPAAPLNGGFYLGVASEEVREGDLMRGRIRLVRIGGTGPDSLLDTFFSRHGWLPVGNRSLLGIPRLHGSEYRVHPHGLDLVIVHQAKPDSPETATFRMRKIAADGGLMFARSYAYTPKPLPDGHASRFVDGRRDGLRAIGLSVSEAERLVSRHSPRFLAPVQEVRIGADGSIWLKREEETGDLVWWNVLDERGEPQANLRLPSRVRIRHVEGDTVWGIETDDLGVYYLLKYRVVR